jgi:hypothetical protein
MMLELDLILENLYAESEEIVLNDEYLKQIATAVSHSPALQTSLGIDSGAEKHRNLCEYLPKLLISNRNNSPHLTTLLLNLICKICRRELAKSTSNYENISLLSSHGVCESIVQKFKEFPEEESVVEAACWCIMVLASDNQDNQVLFANEGGCDLVLTALNHFAGNIEIIEIISRALRNLSSNLSIAAYCIAQGVGDPITGIIVIHTDHPVQLEAALWVVVNLACQTDNATVLGSSGICVAITDALRANLTNEGVVTAACWAIRNLSCGSGFNYVQFSHTDVCKSLVQILLTNSSISSSDLSFPSSVIPACWAISNLTCDNEISEQYGNIEQSCAILVTIFRSYFLQLSALLSIPEFQHLVTEYLSALDAALWAIRNAATGGVSCHTALVSEGIVDIVTSFLESQWVVELAPGHLSTACGVIVNLLSVEYDTLVLAPLLSPTTPLPPVNQIGNLSLCELLCSLMKRFPENKEIQESVCRSYRLLTRIHKDPQPFLSFYRAEGICRLCALALKTHSDAPDLTRNACELLFLLHYESNPGDLELIELIAKDIDETAAATAAAKEEETQPPPTPPPTPTPIRGAVDGNKRVVLRPHEEMVRIWASDTICGREGWEA